MGVSLAVRDAKKDADFRACVFAPPPVLLQIALTTLIDYILWINRKYIQ